MNSKSTTLVILLFLSATVAFSQSVYQLTYNFHTETDSTDYSGLFFKNEDGSGFLKLKYQVYPSGNKVVTTLTVEDSYYNDEKATENAGALIVKTKIEPGNEAGASAAIIPPIFILKEDPGSGFFEPVGVCQSEDNLLMNTRTTFSSKLFAEGELTKTIAANYFEKNETFFTNYFRPKTRGAFKLAPDEKNIKLHLIIVADTKDSAIGYSCVADMKKTMASFDSLRRYIGITQKNFIVQTFSGPTFTINKVKEAIARLKPGPNDIVVFYYSGHGFRVNETDTYPYIKIKTLHTTRKDIMANSLRIKEDVFEKITLLPARLKLVIGDCCNSDIESPKAPGPKPPKTRGDDRWDFNETNTRALFLNKEPVSILVTAAKSGEKARCHPKYNGFFSYSFFSSLKQFTGKGKNNVTWAQLIESAKTGTNSLANLACCSDPCCDRTCTARVRCKQTSIYSIIPGK
jgi:predicted enzyme related to lactoylglutathione lyase